MKTFKHFIPLQVRFNDIDMMGHVNNSIIMEYFDIGRMKYLGMFDVPINFKDKSSLVIVHYEVDFLNQILLEENIMVGTKTILLGNKSIQLEQKIFSNNGTPKCKCISILSGYDAEKNASRTISEELKSKIIYYEENENLRKV